MKKLNNQKGFTLIELVVVIVILGILAATAAPKFIDLQDDARTATLQAVKATMQSAATLVYSKSLIEGNQATAPADGPQVTVNGVLIDIAYGYPRDDDTAEWTNNLVEVEADFTTAVIDGSLVIYAGTAPTAVPVAPYTATADDNCFAFYTEPAAAGDTPNIQVVECL